MKEGRKIYSLLLKSNDNNYYQLKIGDDYRHALAVIDAYTMEFASKELLIEGRSWELQVPILDAKIIYQKQGQTKMLEPVFADDEELWHLRKYFGKSSAIDTNDPAKVAAIHAFSLKLLTEYQTNPDMKTGFDKYGDFLVRESLRNNDLTALICRLCEYRKLRQTIILKKQIKKGQVTNVFPKVVSLADANIIKSDVRLLEITERAIKEQQTKKTDDKVLAKAGALKLEELYDRRDELLKSLDIKEDKNQVSGQTKMMF